MFLIVEYSYFKYDENSKLKVMYRLFDTSDANTLDDAQRFCDEVRKNGGDVNICNREIDPAIFELK